MNRASFTPVDIKIIEALKGGRELSSHQISKEIGEPRAKVINHLKKLTHMGIVKPNPHPEKEGCNVYTLSAPQLCLPNGLTFIVTKVGGFIFHCPLADECDHQHTFPNCPLYDYLKEQGYIYLLHLLRMAMVGQKT